MNSSMVFSTQEALPSRPFSAIIFSSVFEITERELDVGDHRDLNPLLCHDVFVWHVRESIWQEVSNLQAV